MTIVAPSCDAYDEKIPRMTYMSSILVLFLVGIALFYFMDEPLLYINTTHPTHSEREPPNTNNHKCYDNVIKYVEL